MLDPPTTAVVERPRTFSTVHDFPDAEWLTIRDVPVFAEHSTTTKRGRHLTFGQRELQIVANNCNRRIRETGDYAGVIVGHTPEPAESAGLPQMPLVGLAGPFRVARNGGKWSILADFHIQRGKEHLVREYPRRSAELWIGDTYEEMYLDPVALLGAEAPRLDMGLLYSAVRHRDPKREISRYSLTQTEIDQAIKIIEQTDWACWAKSEMSAGKTPGSLPDVQSGPGEVAAYARSCQQFSRLRDQQRECERYRRSRTSTEPDLVAEHARLTEQYERLQRHHASEIQAAVKAASKRAGKGEGGRLFEQELAKRKIPSLSPPPHF
jgi:hypothetical protein